jgi:hypothetical protein
VNDCPTHFTLGSGGSLTKIWPFEPFAISDAVEDAIGTAHKIGARGYALWIGVGPILTVRKSWLVTEAGVAYTSSW